MTEPRLTSSLEDYLESILLLIREKNFARVKDIATSMHVRMASVVNALNRLAEKELIRYVKHEYIELTPHGREIAENIYNRHTIISDFLATILGVDQETARSDACKIEHAISPQTLERLVRFIEFIELVPADGISILKQFQALAEPAPQNAIANKDNHHAYRP
jgi:DtxR family Mn-dependent transcriptional regulator